MRDANNRLLPTNFLRPSWGGFAFLFGLACFLTFTGVYNAVIGLPFWLGWCYWMLTLTVGCLTGYGVIVILHRLGARSFIRYGAAIFASTAAVTSVISVLQVIVGQPLPLPFVPYLFGQVFVISILVFSVGLIYERAKRSPDADTTSSDRVKHFLEHLPIKFRDAKLYAVSSEDHYLRVHTSNGEELILMRLSDAVHELKDVEGLQTHRSWWVAAKAISEVKRENGRVELILKTGVSAPVSRTYQGAVKAANWI